MPRMILAAILGAACISPSAAAQTTPAGNKGLLISTADLAAALKDPALVLLHVGDRQSAFEQAHIPGARFLSYGDFAVNGPDNLGSELPSVAQAKQVFEAVGVSSASRVVVYGTSTVAAARARLAIAKAR